MRTLACLALIVLAGCGAGDPERARTGAEARTSGAAAAPLAAAGDLRIVSLDGQFDLALVGDSVSSGLSPAALEQARRGTDSAQVAGAGLGPSIERIVKGAVSQAVATRAAFPLSAIEDVRYDSGALQFTWVDRSTRIFDQTTVNKRPFLESFAPDDARRFAEAVRARKRR